MGMVVVGSKISWPYTQLTDNYVGGIFVGKHFVAMAMVVMGDLCSMYHDL